MCIKAPKPLGFVSSEPGLAQISRVRRSPPYLWRSGCGGGPSTRHDLLRDVSPPLVGVSYSDLLGWEQKQQLPPTCGAAAARQQHLCCPGKFWTEPTDVPFETLTQPFCWHRTGLRSLFGGPCDCAGGGWGGGACCCCWAGLIMTGAGWTDGEYCGCAG